MWTKNSSKKIPPPKNPSKNFLLKNPPQKIYPKKFLQKNWKIPKKSENSLNNFLKNSQDFENIQFPTSHLEAENPFGLVLFSFLNPQIPLPKVQTFWEGHQILKKYPNFFDITK